MALSIESIYQPLNDFFISQFKTAEDGPILFRFDKFGSDLSDADFMIPGQVAQGYSAAAAIETLSTLVNRIPIDAKDNLNVVLSSDSIDSAYYFRFLLPSVPFVPAGLGDPAKQTTIDAFSAVKQAALHAWENITYESIAGLMLQYKPCTGTPENWYDNTVSANWTHHSLQIAESTTGAPVPANPPLWKLKPDDAAMRSMLQLVDAPPEASANVAARAARVSAKDWVKASVLDGSRTVASAAPPAATMASSRVMASSALRMRPGMVARAASSTSVSGPVASSGPTLVQSSALFDSYVQQRNLLQLSDRLRAGVLLDGGAPMRPSESTSLSVAFDFCVINVRRPWLEGAFVGSTNWYVPGVSKGTLTADGAASALSLMPVGFVAIRNLSIASNWSQVDVNNASLATRFGPFNISTNMMNNTLSHEGLQIIGWILQRMVPLPPNEPSVA